MGKPLALVRAAAATLVVAAVVCAAAAAAPSQIRWEPRIDPAAALSRETGKPILIEFWATWCEACAAMDEKVYSDPAVAEAMIKVLPVRIDVDRDPSTARRYGVAATPTLVLVDAAGDELFRFTGSLQRESLLELLRELPSNIGRINTLAAAVATKKTDFTALDALAGELQREALYVASNRYYERALQTGSARRDAAARSRVLVSIGRNYAALKRPADAADWFGRALREVRGLPEEPTLMLELGRAQAGANQTKDARKTLEELTARFPDSPAAGQAASLLAQLR